MSNKITRESQTSGFSPIVNVHLIGISTHFLPFLFLISQDISNVQTGFETTKCKLCGRNTPPPYPCPSKQHKINEQFLIILRVYS